MTDLFRKHLVTLYDPNSNDAYANFAIETNQAINKHFAELPASKSKLDPARLGSKAVFYAKLRSDLLDKAGGYEIDGHPEFNKLSTSDQLRFQTASRATDTHKWVHNLEILPPTVNAIHMDDRDVAALKALRGDVDTAKLRANIVDVDADALIKLLLPPLLDPAASKLNEVVAALLLATGRRTTEILRSAKFYLAPNGDADGYEAFFTGQAKEGLQETKPYIIPLLAPFFMVNNALELLRKNCDTTKMTTEEVNLKFSKSLNNHLDTVAKLNPHALRAIYAMTCYDALPENRRPALIGYVSQILGHVQPNNAAYYTRLRIVNYQGPFAPANAVVAELADDNADEWIVTCAADNKRLATIKDLMLRRRRVTASAVRTFGLGTMAVISRVILNNKQRIDAYNASL